MLNSGFSRPARFLSVLSAACAAIAVQAADLRSEMPFGHLGFRDQLVDRASRQFARQTAGLTAKSRAILREKAGHSEAWTLPIRFIWTAGGSDLPMAPNSRGPGDLTLKFDDTGSRSFPTEYRDHLQNTFDQAQAAMNAIYGMPKIGGEVKVRNYDADIQDRTAVAGGIYIPNGPDGPEIRFPVYNSSISTSINFIHTLLLAYSGDAQYFSEAWSEGVARAGTMAVSRTAGSIPNPDGLTPSELSNAIEAVMDSLYDVTAFYDWYSQRGLGANPFIAPNLLNTELPAGGSTGGIFLLRYQMAGSAWLKMFAQHPAFIAELNRQFYLSPGAYPGRDELMVLGQQVLDTVTGGPNGTIEGLEFDDWVERQPIFDVDKDAGPQVLLQPFPILPTAGSNDFGVFGLITNAWHTDSSGSETLSSGTVYPVFWRPDGIRFFTSSQEDVVSISGGYGSAVPNFPSTVFGGSLYRVAVDMPFGGLVSRAYLPAGAFATGQSPSPNSFIGTLTGFPLLGSGIYTVRISWNGGSKDTTAQNFAFGASITDEGFFKAQSVEIEVFEVEGSNVTTVLTRRVSKGPGMLALDLRPASSHAALPISLEPKMQLFGMPIQAYRPAASHVVNQDDLDTLAAFYNPITGRFDLFPDRSAIDQGIGAFIRPLNAVNHQVEGRTSPGTPIAVHLQPGWNVVTSPFPGGTPFSDVLVLSASEAPTDFDQAIGDLIGLKQFEWEPNAGNPDAGTFIEATQFSDQTGVFVRSTRAEGGVLVFFPSSPPPTAPILQSPQSLFRWGGFFSRSWEAEIKVMDDQSNHSRVLFGGSSTATDGFDLKHDSPLPFGPGGLQASLKGRLYRDIRSRRGAKRFTVQLEGLVPGKRYWVSSRMIEGRKTLEMVHGSSGEEYDDERWSFRARSTTETIWVEAR